MLWKAFACPEWLRILRSTVEVEGQGSGKDREDSFRLSRAGIFQLDKLMGDLIFTGYHDRERHSSGAAVRIELKLMTCCPLGYVWAEMGKSATQLALCPWLHHKPGTSPPRSSAPSGLGGSQPVDALRGFFWRMETWSGAGAGVGKQWFTRS